MILFHTSQNLPIIYPLLGGDTGWVYPGANDRNTCVALWAPLPGGDFSREIPLARERKTWHITCVYTVAPRERDFESGSSLPQGEGVGGCRRLSGFSESGLAGYNTTLSFPVFTVAKGEKTPGFKLDMV